jgi:putative restriction endonuclease
MAKVVLITRVNPSYDDLPEERYHFPRTYLRTLEGAVGDFAIYYEPRRIDAERQTGGRQVYFACARVTGIEPDPRLADHYYARISDYLDFTAVVPLRLGENILESALRGKAGSINPGPAQRAVRLLPDAEFDMICRLGFAGAEERQQSGAGFQKPVAAYQRPIAETIVRRPYRDAAFARTIGQAYGQTCALTGLRLINGGGNAEIEAAHIRPVGDGHNGPDSVRNGIALCRTAHWLFDRGLVSLDDAYRILVAHDRVPDEFRRLLRPDGQAQVPAAMSLKPHPMFLRYHRAAIFKGEAA